MNVLQVDRVLAGRCATTGGAVDAAAILALGLMYRFEVPKGGPYVFGTANDALGAAGQLLMMPVMSAVTAELPPGSPARRFLPVGLLGCAAGAASGALLVARLLPFAPSTAVSLGAMELQAVWMAATHHEALRRSTLPRGVAHLGRLIGLGMLGGGAVAGAGYVLLGAGTARRVLLGLGIAPMAAAWLAWPVWLQQISRVLQARAAA